MCRRFMHSFYGFLVASVLAIKFLVEAAIRIDYGNTWRFIRELGITAYRKIADLKPVYRESYDTNGLSLDIGRWRS